MKEFFNMPAQLSLICFTPIGVPSEWPQTPSKKDLDEVVIFEKFEKSLHEKTKKVKNEV